MMRLAVGLGTLRLTAGRGWPIKIDQPPTEGRAVVTHPWPIALASTVTNCVRASTRVVAAVTTPIQAAITRMRLLLKGTTSLLRLGPRAHAPSTGRRSSPPDEGPTGVS